MVTNESVQPAGLLEPAAAARSGSWLKLLPFMVGILAFLARIPYIGRSFDVFIDEVTYLQIARSVGFKLQLVLAGRPFFLHPPLWFIIEGAYLRLFNVTGNLIAQVWTTRILVAVFAAVSGVLIFLIVRRAAGWPAALIAAGLFALDPFVIKLNSMNMLETSAMTWVLAGYWVLISALPVSDERLLPWRRLLPSLLAEGPQPLSVRRQLLAGLFFGFALLTKEMMFLVTLAPLAIFFLLRWPLSRRALASIAGLSVGLYALYPAGVILAGEWSRFVFAKTHGFVRFAGFVRSTGFKRPGGPSLIQTLSGRMTYYGTTYLLIALGLIAILVLLRRGGTIGRVVAVWVLCTYAMLSYGVFLGTLEEQFFYYLVVACIVADSIAAAVLLRSLAWRPVGRVGLVAAAALLMAVMGFNAAQWQDVHSTPNDGFANILAYLQQHVPKGEGVASTSETGQYVLQGYLSGPWGSWTSADALKAAKPDFVVVTPRTVRWNDATSAQALLDWIDKNGQQVYVFSGRENNVLRLYRLPWASAAAKDATSAVP